MSFDATSNESSAAEKSTSRAQGSSLSGAGPSDSEIHRLVERLSKIPAAGFESAGNFKQRLTLAIERWSKRVGIRQLARFVTQRKRVRSTLERVPVRLQLVTNQTRLVLELIEDFVSGTYTQLPWHTVMVASGALIYSVSPSDVIPDVIPFLGSMDDIAVLAIAMRLIEKDLRAYCRFKGYQEQDYFRK